MNISATIHVTKEGLTALDKSILKWQEIAAGRGVDKATMNCALCEEYYDGDCYQCPVYLYTGRPECTNTPYWSFNTNGLALGTLTNREGNVDAITIRAAYSPKSVQAAKDEIKFLKKVRDICKVTSE